jgi:hypothetical protein
VRRALLSGLGGLLVIALLIAGCGGGGDGSTTESVALTKAELIKQGDAICRAAEEEKSAALMAAFAKQAKQAKQTKELSTVFAEELVFDAVLPAITKMTEELAALGAPSGGGDMVGAIVGNFEKGIERMEATPGEVVSGEVEPFAKADKLAQDYGFKECSRI